MAAVKAFAGATGATDSWSLSRGVKDYLSCCFIAKAQAPRTNDEKVASDVGGSVLDDVTCQKEEGVERHSADGASLGSETTDGYVRDNKDDGGDIDRTAADGTTARDVNDGAQLQQQQQVDELTDQETDGTNGIGLTVDEEEHFNEMAAFLTSIGNDPDKPDPNGDQNEDNNVDPDAAVVNEDNDQLEASRSSAAAVDVARSDEEVEEEQDADGVEADVGGTSASTTVTPATSSRLISQCGRVRLSIQYVPPTTGKRGVQSGTGRMTVIIIEAADLPDEGRGGASHCQFHAVVLPARKVRHKTRVRPGTAPQFDEKIEFKISPDEMNTSDLRLRLYSCERLRRERMIGECLVAFDSLGVQKPAAAAAAGDSTSPHPVIEQWFTLTPRSNMNHGDSAGDLASLSGSAGGSTGSLSAGSSDVGGSPTMSARVAHAELMIGLAYNENTGRLAVEVIKGSNFRSSAGGGSSRPPDTQVRLALMGPDGKQVSDSKTSIRRGQPNPLFKETFMFQVPMFQLAEVSLMVSVYNLRSLKRKEMIGWFSLGSSNSSEEESTHWAAMREGRGDLVCRWHMLIEP